MKKRRQLFIFEKYFDINFGEIPTFIGISGTPSFIMGDKVLLYEEMKPPLIS